MLLDERRKGGDNMSKSLEEYVEHRVQTANLAELKEFMREQLLDYYYDWDKDELKSIGIKTKETT